MAIKEYIPKKESIIDRRSINGGYYIAECDVCGREFYPKKSNAKYCSRSCAMIAYRLRKDITKNANDIAQKYKKDKNEEVEQKRKAIDEWIDRKTVLEFFKKKKVNKYEVREICKRLNIGEEINITGRYMLYRDSDRRYSIYKDKA